MNRLLLAVLLSALYISSCTYSDRQNTYSSNRVDLNRNYPIDDRNGFKDLLFGQHIDSIKAKLSDDAGFGEVLVDEKNIINEKKNILTVQNSYLNSLGEIKFSKVDLYFFDNELFEIRFDRSAGDPELFYDTLVEAFGFRPSIETGWYRSKTIDEWWTDTRKSYRSGEPYTDRVDLESRIWKGRSVSARLIGEKWGSSLFGRKPDDIIWSDLRLWNLELQKEAEKYVLEAPSRTAKDF